MTGTSFVLRGLRFYRGSYAGVLAGAALGAMVLLGALMAGDSVKGTLRQRDVSISGGSIVPTRMPAPGIHQFSQSTMARARSSTKNRPKNTQPPIFTQPGGSPTFRATSESSISDGNASRGQRLREQSGLLSSLGCPAPSGRPYPAI